MIDPSTTVIEAPIDVNDLALDYCDSSTQGVDDLTLDRRDSSAHRHR
jgi:hypothetical protein